MTSTRKDEEKREKRSPRDGPMLTGTELDARIGGQLGAASGPRRLALERRSQGDRPSLHRHRVRLLLLAGVLARAMRMQLARPEQRFSAPSATTRSSPCTARR